MNGQKKRILFADDSKPLYDRIAQDKACAAYEIEWAKKGRECLKKIIAFKPDLVFLDLMLPELHGIEVLREMKENPDMSKIGVIITSSYPMLQSWRTAVKLGADYFLDKPYSTETFFSLVKRYFAKDLKPDPFQEYTIDSQLLQECISLPSYSTSSYIKFWGTRGSNPVSGAEYVRFGGNTCSLEVCNGKDRIIIDAGTGIRPLGNALDLTQEKVFHLFIGHTHWDHILGFPFFAPLYDADCEIHIWAPIGYEKKPKELFTEMLAYSYFPVRLDDIKAKLIFNEIYEGDTIKIGSISVQTRYAFHPGASLCFKVNSGGKTFGYATDNEMFKGYHGHPSDLDKEPALVELYQDLIHFFKHCDYLIHEAQYFPEEYKLKTGWGHSSITNAVALVKYCNAQEWIVTHHDPAHTDNDLIKKVQLQHDILKDYDYKCRVRMAYDGYFLPL